MLLEFSCSNYKAIKEKIVFSMVAGSDKSHQEELYEFDDYRVSRITSVYGANGAGKSTLIDAVGYLGFLVRECVIRFREHHINFQQRNRQRLIFSLLWMEYVMRMDFP